MKIAEIYTNVEKRFESVALILETQEEVDKVFALSNYSTLQDALGLYDLYRALHPYRFNGYGAYHDKIDKLLK